MSKDRPAPNASIAKDNPGITVTAVGPRSPARRPLVALAAAILSLSAVQTAASAPVVEQSIASGRSQVTIDPPIGKTFVANVQWSRTGDKMGAVIKSQDAVGHLVQGKDGQISFRHAEGGKQSIDASQLKMIGVPMDGNLVEALQADDAHWPGWESSREIGRDGLATWRAKRAGIVVTVTELPKPISPGNGRGRP